jgi:hypothetical protein
MTSIICMYKNERRMQIRLRNSQVSYNDDYVLQHRGENLNQIEKWRLGLKLSVASAIHRLIKPCLTIPLSG